jgi:hypothetical protein
VSEEILAQLDIKESELTKKALDYAMVIKQNEYEADIIDLEIKRLTAMKKARNNTGDRLRKVIAEAMDKFGHPTVKTPTISLSIRKTESVEIIDENALPKEAGVWKFAPDKKKIKEMIEAKQEVLGAEIVTKTSLTIK